MRQPTSQWPITVYMISASENVVDDGLKWIMATDWLSDKRGLTSATSDTRAWFKGPRDTGGRA